MNFPYTDFKPDEPKPLLSWPREALPPSGKREQALVSCAAPQSREPRIPPGEDELLLLAGMSPVTLKRVCSLARRWGVPLAEAALAIGAVRSQSYLRAVAAAAGIAPHQIRSEVELRPFYPAPRPYRLLENCQPAPLTSPEGAVALNVETVAPETIAKLADALGPARERLALVTRSTLTQAISRTYRAELVERAASGLWMMSPRMSAATGLTRGQSATLCILAGLFAGAVIFAPRETVTVYASVLSLMFFLTITLRLAAAGHALFRSLCTRKTHFCRLPDAELPQYTVLVAMYREARVLPELVASLRALDYPLAKLDIKLVLEEVDKETIAAAKALKLPPHFELFIVPDGAPRTKPRALNYALQFARGEYLVIYDAEDRPDPQQLRKAAAHFRGAGPDVVCLQGKLTYDNASENWLAKQFTIEYASLFGGMLPMLDRAGLPIPLGGTSNHFRINILRRLGGWDAHNVTEDADLGLRIYRAGLRAQVLDSFTYEEAACQPGNWLRQRTRWLKGWMQTYSVHMRQPRRLLRELGVGGFVGVQGLFAGIIIAALVHPWSYVLIIADIAAGSLFTSADTVLGQQILLLALFNLVVGYAASLALGFFVLQSRARRGLIPQLFFIPVYWLFISAAAYRALYQFATAPHYWEKTEHGLSKVRSGAQHERKGSRRPA